MQVTENLIQKYKDVDCVFALNDEMALGAIQALKAAGMNDVLVVGFDANADAANAIQKGEMWGTFNMDHFGIGYAAAVYLVLKLDYDIVANNNWVLFPGASVTQMITKETVEDYMKNSRWY
jgi:ABC-type sugar transport system substrate-binding protein